MSAVVGLHRGDRLLDWQREWIERWKAENQPDGPHPKDDALARFEAYRGALEEAARTEGPPSGEYFYLQVTSEVATSLPRTIFDAERDVRWVVNREARTIERG